MIKQFSNFISKEKCEKLISEYASKFETVEKEIQTILQAERLPTYYSFESKEFASDLWGDGKTASLLPIWKDEFQHVFHPVGFDSHINILKYLPGEFMGEHEDSPPPPRKSNTCFPGVMIIYLNEVKGGELQFPNEFLKIEPEPGLAVAFLINGVVHQALPVLEGEKYCIVLWLEYETGDSEFRREIFELEKQIEECGAVDENS